MKLASQVAALLPPKGTLLTRRFGQGAIDLGSFQGVKKDDALVIVRKGSVRLRSDGPGLSYDESDVVGDFHVTGLDEAVSEGTVTGRGYFDYVNAGDQVLYPVKKSDAPTVTPAQRSGTSLHAFSARRLTRARDAVDTPPPFPYIFSDFAHNPLAEELR